jgi:hypothetical protein
MKIKLVKYIDPPSGWKFCFPKKLPDPPPMNVGAWLVENGYPQSEVNLWKGHVPYRIIIVEEVDVLESQSGEGNN